MRVRLLFLLTAILTALTSSAQTHVGALRHGDVFEISVVYTNLPDISSALDLSHYALAPGNLVSSRSIATNYGVALIADSVPAASPATLSISGVTDPDGNEFPGEIINFNTGNLFWAAIGGQELGLAPNAYAFGSTNFDVFSGGIQQKDDYEEATFVGESITGDFERMVRVDYVEPSGGGARAGLMVRESLDEGKSRPLDPESIEQGFSRYLEIAVNSAVDAEGNSTGAGVLVLQRAETASNFTEQTDDGQPPTFPDAWLRIVRSGQNFSLYRGTNGTDWVKVTEKTFPATFPDNAYVGVAFSPQNDDLSPTSGVRKSFVAKFRAYGSKAVSPGKLTIKLVGDHAELSWTNTGTLETATDLGGPWTTAASQANPQNVVLEGSTRFFRLH